jgi:hypothetical protein
MSQKVITTADSIGKSNIPDVQPETELARALDEGYTIAFVTQSVVPTLDGSVWLYRTWVLNPPPVTPRRARVVRSY